MKRELKKKLYCWNRILEECGQTKTMDKMVTVRIPRNLNKNVRIKVDTIIKEVARPFGEEVKKEIISEILHQHQILSLGLFRLQRLNFSVFLLDVPDIFYPLVYGGRVVLFLLIVFYYCIDICYSPSFSYIIITFMICPFVSYNISEKINFFNRYFSYLFLC